MAENRYERGLQKLKEIVGDAGERLTGDFSDVAPDLARYGIEFIYGDLYSNPALDVKIRQLAVVAALVALGTAQPELKVHIGAALQVGWTREEIIAAITHLAGYAGFPAAINGVLAAREVFASQD